MCTASILARISRIGAAVVLFAATIGPGSGHSALAQAPVTLTFWSWVPNLQQQVNLFEKSHPTIKVNLVNAGVGLAQYTKLRTALKAGTGAPDVVQIEYQYLPTFELTGKLVDLSQYGANSYKNDFIPWTWDQVSMGTKVYGIPQDSGPMGLLYRSDIFAKYHLAVPATWAQLGQEAIALHKANPKVYLTDFTANEGGWFTALLWQAGVRPFKVKGTTLSIDVNAPAARQVANYWGDLVKADAVSTLPDFTTSFATALTTGALASWLVPAWGANVVAGAAGKTTGHWRAAPLPQWTAGAHVFSNWGGASDAVTTQSQHPKEAAEFAIWLNDNVQSASMFVTVQSEFPVTKAVLNSPSLDAPQPFYGGQRTNKIFADASSHIDLGFQWSPFQDYVYTQMQNDFANAINARTSFAAALDTLQNTLVNYAKAQGFTVM
jgi:multiple sugar transport system substrate-binding protein